MARGIAGLEEKLRQSSETSVNHPHQEVRQHGTENTVTTTSDPPPHRKGTLVHDRDKRTTTFEIQEEVKTPVKDPDGWNHNHHHNRRETSAFADDHVPVDEKKEEPLQGNFRHMKKSKQYDFADWSRRKDGCFHVEIATDCESYFQTQRLRVQDAKTEHFAFIVDLDGYEYHKVVFHSFLNELLCSSFFRFSILLLVVLNAVLLGLQTRAELLKRYQKYFNVIDQIILSVFIFEIVIKWVYDFRLFWKVLWNIMDFVIVFLIILSAVIPAFGNSSKLLVGVRVVRSFRSLRSVSFLTSLSIVKKTIVNSFKEMQNIFLVMMIFMFTQAIMGVILFDAEIYNFKKRFLSAADAWYVIFICVTQDGWNTVLKEFRNPQTENFFLMAVYLIIAVSIGAFIFANLIVAVIVTNLELAVRELREEKMHSQNPLTYNMRTSEPLVDVYPIYDLLTKNPVHLLSQRPLRVPTLGKISARRIQAYVNVIVALEQNMMEAEIINKDLERILAVLLSLSFQLDIYSQQKAVEDDLKRTYKQAVEKSRVIEGTITTMPPSLKASEASTSIKVKPLTTLPIVDPGEAKEDLAYMQVVKHRGNFDANSEDENPPSSQAPLKITGKDKKKPKTRN